MCFGRSWLATVVRSGMHRASRMRRGKHIPCHPYCDGWGIARLVASDLREVGACTVAGYVQTERGPGATVKGMSSSVCPNPKCNSTDNPPGELVCQMCGAPLGAEGGSSTSTLKPRAPNVKR